MQSLTGARLVAETEVVGSHVRLRLTLRKGAAEQLDVAVAPPIAILLVEKNLFPVLDEDVLQRVAQFLAWDSSDGLAAGYRVCVSWRAAFGAVAQHTLVQVEGRQKQLTSSQGLHRPMAGCKRRHALISALNIAQLASLFERVQIESDFWRSLVLTMRDDLASLDHGSNGASRHSDVSLPKHQRPHGGVGGHVRRSPSVAATTKVNRAREFTFGVVESVCAIILNSVGQGQVPTRPDVSLYKALLGEPGRALVAMRGVQPKRLDVSTDRMDRIRQFAATQVAGVAQKRVSELGGSTVGLLSAWVAAVMDEADFFAHEPDAIDLDDELELLNRHQSRLRMVFTAAVAHDERAPRTRRQPSPLPGAAQRPLGGALRTRKVRSVRVVRAETSLHVR